jgi:hypothetical protein
VLFALIVMELESSRAENVTFFGMFTLPARIYPWALLVFLSLLSPSLSFIGHLAGVLVGYALSFGYLSRIVPSDFAFDEAETRLGLKSLPAYRPSPYADGGSGIHIWSRGAALPTTATTSSGSTSSSLATVARGWAEVVGAWFRGLGAATAEPVTSPRQAQASDTRTGVPATSRLLATEKPATSLAPVQTTVCNDGPSSATSDTS